VRIFISALTVFVITAAAEAQLVITPTTTLTAATGNNTSAADSFSTQTNGNLGAGNISKMPVRSLLYPGATTKIYAHFMPWFGGSNHMNVGYRSDDPAQVQRQVEDMISRGINGAIIDWYGPNFARENNTTIYMMREAAARPGFEFAVIEDAGALRSCAKTSGCDVTQRMIDDLNYAASTFYGSRAYMRRDGRPVVFFFGVDAYSIDWNRVRAGAAGNPLFVFRNAGAFTHAQTNGGFSWVGISGSDPNSPGTGYLDNFYGTAQKYPQLKAVGSAYPGFNDSLAAWAPDPPRVVNRNCGATWLATMADAGKWYSASNQLQEFQLVTWNDYEEGTEIESGIDNCVSVTPSVSGKQLSWSVSGDAKTIDHFIVYISLDGENLMILARADAMQRALDLGQFNLGAGTFKLYVKAYARASMKNQTSDAAQYIQPVQMQILSPGNGATVPNSFPLLATAATAAPVQMMRVYVDSILVYSRSGTNQLDALITAPAGKRRLRVEAVDTAGAVVGSSIMLQVQKSGLRSAGGSSTAVATTERSLLNAKRRTSTRSR
jgi:hypothetical protein